jgi:methylated-DNA-[protein]-cysteine S-methyltransferase
MRLSYHVMSSPLGLLFLARSETGLKCLRFMDRKSIKRMIAAHEKIWPGAEWTPSLLELKPVVDQLEAYFCGALARFDYPLDPDGTEFQRQVWKALLDIPFAEKRSYGQVAKAIRQPRAARAVGLANNQNPIAIVIPCHRVVGANGALTGYGGGVKRKRWLLEHEARFAGMTNGDGDLFTAAASDRSAGRRTPR